MSDPNPNERSDWQMYEVLVIALCVGLAFWGILSGASAVRSQAIAANRSDTRQKIRVSTDTKSEKALTTFASLDTNKIRFRVPLDLALKQAAIKMESNATDFRELLVSRAPDPGRELFQAKLCFTCHQTDPTVPALNQAVKAPAFIGDFWGREREIEIDGDPSTPLLFEASGKFETVLMDEAYFFESVEKPMAKIVKGSLAAMAPLPTTPEERRALMEYVKSLSKE